MDTRKKTLSSKALTLGTCLLLIGTLALASLSGCSSPSTGNGTSGTESNSGSNGGSAGQSTGQQNSTAKVAEGQPALDFEFTTVDGKTAKLSDYKGQVVLLNFWATWCGYCVQEMPDMQKIAEKYSGVTVLAINRSDSTQKATTFAEDSGYDFVWGLDESGSIAKLYPSNGIPYTIVIDEDGVISTIINGSPRDAFSYFNTAVIEAGATADL